MRIFVSKVMSLFFTMLSRFVVAFLPKNKCLLISWLKSLSTVILEPKKIKSLTLSIVSPSICREWWGWMSWSSSFECWILTSFRKMLQFSSVQPLSPVWFFATPWTAVRQASLSITISQSLLKLMSIESVMPSNHLILCLLLLPSIFPSIRVFSNESALHIMWPKYWSFSLNISPSNEHPGLICFRMDWLDLLAVQGTLKSLLQHHSSKASILQCSAFLIVQLSHPYMTTGKTIALTRRTYVVHNFPSKE